MSKEPNIPKLLAELPSFRSLACTFEAGAEGMGDIADRLGRLAAVRAELEDYEAKLKEIVILNAAGSIEGRLFRTTLSVFEQSGLDTKRIREKMKPGWLKRFSLPPRTITKVLTKARIGAVVRDEAA